MKLVTKGKCWSMLFTQKREGLIRKADMERELETYNRLKIIQFPSIDGSSKWQTITQ